MQNTSETSPKNSNVSPDTGTNKYSAVDLKIGEEGIVSAILGDDSFKQRLVSMGIMVGSVINAPITAVLGNPRTYMVRGYQLCMRSDEAMKILLKNTI